MKHSTITSFTWLLTNLAALPAAAFQPTSFLHRGRAYSSSRLKVEEWTGEVVSNTDDGRIKGCKITTVGETEFTIRIDG